MSKRSATWCRKPPLPVIFLITNILCGLAGTPKYGTPVWFICKRWKGNLNSIEKKKHSPVGTIKTHHFTDSTESLGPNPHSTKKTLEKTSVSLRLCCSRTLKWWHCSGIDKFCFTMSRLYLWCDPHLKGLWKNHHVSALFPHMSLMLSRQHLMEITNFRYKNPLENADIPTDTVHPSAPMIPRCLQPPCYSHQCTNAQQRWPEQS